MGGFDPRLMGLGGMGIGGGMMNLMDLGMGMGMGGCGFGGLEGLMRGGGMGARRSMAGMGGQRHGMGRRFL
jgi:hypothetical protein